MCVCVMQMMARGDDIDCVCQILSGNVREDEGEEPAGVKEIGIVPAPMIASSSEFYLWHVLVSPDAWVGEDGCPCYS